MDRKLTPPFRTVLLVQDLEFGGTQRYAVQLLKHLDRSLFSPELWVLRGGKDMLPLAEEANVKIVFLSLSPQGRSPRHRASFVATDALPARHPLHAHRGTEYMGTALWNHRTSPGNHLKLAGPCGKAVGVNTVALEHTNRVQCPCPERGHRAAALCGPQSHCGGAERGAGRLLLSGKWRQSRRADSALRGEARSGKRSLDAARRLQAYAADKFPTLDSTLSEMEV